MVEGQRCSNCKKVGHNITTCGKLQRGTLHPAGSKHLNTPPSSVKRTFTSEVLGGAPFSDIESVVEKLRITTPAYPEGDKQVSHRGPSSGYGALRIPEGEKIGKDTGLVRHLKNSTLSVSQVKAGPVRTYTSPLTYWRRRKNRQPSPGYEILTPDGGERLNVR